MNGKTTLVGIYTGDITVAVDGQTVNQMVFYFIVQGDLSDVPKTMALEVKLPGLGPTTREIPMDRNALVATAERTKWFVKVPVPIFGAPLRSGKIEAKVVFDNEEIHLAPQWILGPKPPAQP
jgi:hypothetical protein